jgi:hypothetical protein
LRTSSMERPPTLGAGSSPRLRSTHDSATLLPCARAAQVQHPRALASGAALRCA